MKYMIRKTSDLDIVSELDSIIFDEPYDIDGVTWWVAFADNIPVAYGGIKAYNTKYAELCRSGVLENHIGHGLQRKLIKKRLEWAKDNNFKGVVTYTLWDNLYSANNLIKEGFLMCNPSHTWDSEVEPVIYWIKEF